MICVTMTHLPIDSVVSFGPCTPTKQIHPLLLYVGECSGILVGNRHPFRFIERVYLHQNSLGLPRICVQIKERWDALMHKESRLELCYLIPGDALQILK